MNDAVTGPLWSSPSPASVGAPYVEVLCDTPTWFTTAPFTYDVKVPAAVYVTAKWNHCDAGSVCPTP